MQALEPDARKRLLARDNIGIIPSYVSAHRANQHFKAHEDVFDVVHYDDPGRFKRRILPFITWEPLPILRPGKKSDNASGGRLKGRIPSLPASRSSS